MSDSIKAGLSSWTLIVIYLLILAVLAIFGDLFIFITGAILETIVFALGSDQLKGDH